MNRRRTAWSESDEDEEPLQRQPEAEPDQETDMQVSDGEVNRSGGAADDEE